MENPFFWRQYSRIIFPNLCLHCDAVTANSSLSDTLLCTSCGEDLADCQIPHCELPGVTTLGRTVWGTWYYRLGSPIRSLHRSLKFESSSLSGSYIGERLRLPQNLRDQCDSDSFCIPIPSHRTKILERGIQHTSVLAHSVASHLCIQMLPHVLVRKRLADSQSDLNREDRLSNMKEAFSLNTSLSGKHVVLVDDVMTTGATLDAASLVLESSGATVSLYTVAFRRESFERAT